MHCDYLCEKFLNLRKMDIKASETDFENLCTPTLDSNITRCSYSLIFLTFAYSRNIVEAAAELIHCTACLNLNFHVFISLCKWIHV